MLLGMEIVSFPECGWKEGRREGGRGEDGGYGGSIPSGLSH